MQAKQAKQTRQTKQTKKSGVLFYAVIALLTVGIIALGSLPYIMSRKGEEVTPGKSTGEYPPNGEGVDQYGRPAADGQEMRGVWIAFFNLKGVDKAMIDGMVARCKENGMNTIFFHVRPFCDALYASDYYPWSHLVTGTQGVAPADGFDPLAYAVKAAHREGIALHAWLNPLRVMRDDGSIPPSLSDDNPYNVWRNDSSPDNDIWVIDYKKGKYLNPAVPEVREYIVNGTREIVERYNVDGIHWDDYFYPAYDESFDDSASYSAYKEQGGRMSLLQWRTDNINQLVKSVYSAVKSADKSCVFGISPAGNVDNCLRMGAEVTRWGSEEGFVDYLMPQVYFSSENSVCPFEPTCRKWDALITCPDVKLYIGLALYKAGTDADRGQWLKADDMMMNQILYTRSDALNADGFVLFSYDDFGKESKAEEMKNLRSVLN